MKKLFRLRLALVCVISTHVQAKSPQDEGSSHVRSQLNLAQSVFAGCTAGICDVVVNHPLWAIKIMMQNKEPLNLYPSSLYRGLVSNTLAMIPLTTTRITISSYLQQKAHSTKEEDSTKKIVISSFVGGVFPALFGGPTELLRNLEHKYKKNFWEIYEEYITKKGYAALFRGTPGVALRDGVYTTSFAAFVPLLSHYFEKEKNVSPYKALLAAGATSGIFAAVFSHPFDTIKVIQQARSLEKDMSMLDTIVYFHTEEEGSKMRVLKRIYSGILPRGIRTASGVIVISAITAAFNNHFYNSKN